jgi:hypothetical protein
LGRPIRLLRPAAGTTAGMCSTPFGITEVGSRRRAEPPDPAGRGCAGRSARPRC